ncbi:MAG: CDP-glycerol glycerophosphotransferase family protein [Simkaniaceae bacterium]|nr:CDP-glycerol glycerophosphotransferase family protein [Simkaniaceae bacterium]
MKLASLIFGHALHHLDHLAPLSYFLDIPLLVTDPLIKEAAETHYPGLIVYEMTPFEMSSQTLEHFDGVVSCLTRKLLDPLFLVAETIHGKKLTSIWCPHGNSDKGHLAPFMEGLEEESLILVYGQKMVDFIRQKNGKVPKHLFVGNYRYPYYLQFQSFYDSWLSSLLPKEKTMFYAPTWNDSENSSSLISALPCFKEIADSLFIKLHPNTLLQHPHLIEQLNTEYPKLSFLPAHAPIYPLLERAKLYIGDMSSIGYDYLSFNRPMFFFNTNQRSDHDLGLYLYRCGEEMPTSFSNTQEDLREIRQAVYEYTFKKVDPSTLKKELLEALQ